MFVWSNGIAQFFVLFYISYTFPLCRSFIFAFVDILLHFLLCGCNFFLGHSCKSFLILACNFFRFLSNTLNLWLRLFRLFIFCGRLCRLNIHHCRDILPVLQFAFSFSLFFCYFTQFINAFGKRQRLWFLLCGFLCRFLCFRKLVSNETGCIIGKC